MTQEQYRFPTDFSEAEMAAYDVCCWIRDNHTDFKRLMFIVNHQVDLGNPCVKQGELEMFVRESGMELDLGGEFRHNRNLYPGLTRYMVMLLPRLARALHFRKSKLDEVDLVGMWHFVVNPRTAFLADNRYMAERMVRVNDPIAS